MRLQLSEWFSSASGKLCGHSDKYVSVHNGKTFSGTICNPYKGAPTESQTAVYNRFRAAAQARTTIIADSALHQQWNTRFRADRAEAKTRAVSLNGYLTQQYFLGHVAEDGAYKA